MMSKFGNHRSGINNLPLRNMTQGRHPVLFYGNYNLAATCSISAREEEGHFPPKGHRQGHGQEGGFSVFLPTFLICKDTQCRRASSVNNFKFSPCYTWDKIQIPCSRLSPYLPVLISSPLSLVHSLPACFLAASQTHQAYSHLRALVFAVPSAWKALPSDLQGSLLHFSQISVQMPPPSGSLL